jgi:glycosyltransferase involved in cell wall biosynthesis
MHVLILAQYYPPDLGGSSTRAYNVARGLVLNGVKTTVVTAFPHYPHGEIPRRYWGHLYVDEYDHGVRVIRTFMVPLKSQGLLYRAVTFAVFISSSLIGLLLLHSVDALWVANPDVFGVVPALVYRALHKCSILFNVDDMSMDDVDDLKMLQKASLLYKLASMVTRFLYRKVDLVTPISQGYYKGIMGLGVEERRIRLLRGGVDLDIFRIGEGSRRTNMFTVTYSGSFSVAYDFSQVIQAAKLLQGYDDIEFVIQGKGEQGPIIRAEILHNRIRNVRFIDKILTRDEVAELLSEVSALILPLKNFGRPYLGISSKLYEYQALGKPIIACTEGASADYVEHTHSCIVISPGRPELIADAVLNLHSNPHMCAHLGSNGRKYVEDNMSLTTIGAQMRRIIENAGVVTV